MADISESTAYRDSSVYVSAKIQGNLELKKGVLGSKSKQWCSLQGSTLYLQKKQGDVMKNIHLKDVILVRKVTGEYTGTHFEICMKKKTFLFICPSSENCSAWVAALNATMTLMNSGVSNADDKDIYTEVDEALVSDSCGGGQHLHEKPTTAAPKLCEYTDPVDKATSVRKLDDDYWEIGEIRTAVGQPQQLCKSIHDEKKNSTEHSSVGQIYEVVTSELVVNSSCDQDYADPPYSVVHKVKRTTSREASENLNNMTQERSEISNKEEAHCDSHSETLKLNDHKVTSSFVDKDEKSADSYDSQKLNTKKEEGDYLFEILSTALTDRSSPIRDLIHPLTEEDRQPVEELIIFLSQHSEICHASYLSVPINDDPVNSLKTYLRDLDVHGEK